MKYLVTWTWKREDIEECWKRYEKDRTVESVAYGEGVFPQHLLVGKNKGFAVIDITDMEEWYKANDKWSDLLLPFFHARMVM